MSQDPDMHMTQDPDDGHNDDGTLSKSISTLPNMSTVTSSAGLLLKNPTKTTAI